ncbi:putative neutral sphingomyelinase [Eupeodes corollae]|uniref:putative neutral sphingomyelinase n=1 Tax=Eupeodes corollae TaxID=290404 RepID=UPI00248FD3B5|nr:putative neutral sphingomyelinase [Eupeodes corollae]
MSVELNILTLNIWGIPYISDDRETRINSISSELATGKYDIVSLQEVWSQNDYNSIKQNLETVLPFSHYFYSGVMGAGLCVLSKYPIIGALFHAWSVNGYFHRIQHADWFGGKGVGLCKILVNGHLIHFYNAHLHAEYDVENDEYKTHRVIQAFDTAQFIEETRGNSILQILAGDLNTQPQDISYKVLLYTSKMIDSCPDENIGTNECHHNSYTSKKLSEKNPNGIRIDHIFIRSAESYDAHIAKYSLPLPERIPGMKISYSDHEAVMTKLKLTSKQCSSDKLVDDKNEFCEKQSSLEESELKTIEVLQECVHLCETSLHKLKTDRILYFSIAIFVTFLLLALVDYSVPIGFKTLYLLLKFILFGIILFALFMGSLWNYIEQNGILSGKTSMEIKLRRLGELELELH